MYVEPDSVKSVDFRMSEDTITFGKSPERIYEEAFSLCLSLTYIGYYTFAGHQSEFYIDR